MRLFRAVIAATLMAGLAPAAAWADGMPPAPGCHCLRPVRHHVRHKRHYVRHVRRAVRVAVAPLPPAPVSYYNPLLPSTWNSDYDRAMALHFRSPPVNGIYYPDPGYAATPPVAGVMPYKIRAYGTVYQYDGMAGGYVALAQADAVRALPPPPPPLPPPAAPPPVPARP